MEGKKMGSRNQRASATEKWEQRISECQRSELTVASYCKEHNLPKSTYYLWQKKLRDKKRLDGKKITRQKEKKFIEVSCQGVCDPKINLFFKNGIRLELPEAVGSNLLNNLLNRMTN